MLRLLPPQSEVKFSKGFFVTKIIQLMYSVVMSFGDTPPSSLNVAFSIFQNTTFLGFEQLKTGNVKLLFKKGKNVM